MRSYGFVLVVEFWTLTDAVLAMAWLCKRTVIALLRVNIAWPQAMPLARLCTLLCMLAWWLGLQVQTAALLLVSDHNQFGRSLLMTCQSLAAIMYDTCHRNLPAVACFRTSNVCSISDLVDA